MRLALFFTRGVSLKLWLDKGLFDREKLIYEEHLKQGNLRKIYWITYGSEDKVIAEKLKKEGRLHKDIEILPMPKIFDNKFGKIIYSFLIPFIHRKVLKHVDILKTNQMDGSWSAVLTKWIYKKPLIVRTGYTWSQLENYLRRKTKLKLFIIELIEKFAYNNANISVVSSLHNKEYIVEKYKVKNIEVIPNFIDIQRFKPLNLTKMNDRIVYVGRISEEKNLFNLIQAIAKLNLTLDIYGSGELEEELKNEADRLKANVNFYGVVSNKDLPEILNRYRYFILPSYFEGMPKSLLEAMACGLLCIGTDVKGINEVIKDGENGILIYGIDVNALVNALERAINLSPNRYIEIIDRARKLVEENFSLNSCVEREKKIFYGIARNFLKEKK